MTSRTRGERALWSTPYGNLAPATVISRHWLGVSIRLDNGTVVVAHGENLRPALAVAP